jgi:hypothetical protein
LHRALHPRYVSTEPLFLLPIPAPFVVEGLERHVQDPLQDLALAFSLDALD